MDSIRQFSPAQLSRAPTHSHSSVSENSLEQESSGQPSSDNDTYQEGYSHVGDLDENEELLEGQRQESELLGRYHLLSCTVTSVYLEDLLERLLENSRRPDIDYRFLALDTPTPFASSCCHGAVYFSLGLLEALEEPSVLFFAAHEMAHTELRHFASRQRRLEELRRAIPAPFGSSTRQRLELAAVLAVRHQEEFEADALAARWLSEEYGPTALRELHEQCRILSPESLNRPTHPPFEERVRRAAEKLAPPEPLEYLWSLISH